MSSEYLTLKAAAATYPIPGYPLSAHTLWRWCRTGIKSHKLRHVKIGKSLLTRRDWIEQFLAELEEKPAVEPYVPLPLTATQQQLAERGL